MNSFISQWQFASAAEHSARSTGERWLKVEFEARNSEIPVQANGSANGSAKWKQTRENNIVLAIEHRAALEN